MLDNLKKYAHSLHQLAGKIQNEEITSSKAWWMYRCKLVEFLFEHKEHFVQKEIKGMIHDLGYRPVSYWARKFGVSRQFTYRNIIQDGHIIEFEKGIKYVTFEIGYQFTRKRETSTDKE